MQRLNPFSPKTISYHRLSKEASTEHKQENDQDTTPNSSQNQNEDEEADHHLLAKQLRHRSRRMCLRQTCVYMLLSLTSLLIGLAFGEMFRLEYDVDGYIEPYASAYHNVPNVVWQKNVSFVGEPSAAMEKAWEGLIPKGRGFVRHDVLTKGELMSMSVFHEIHCLHGLLASHHLTTYQLSKLRYYHPTLFPSTSSSTFLPHHPPPRSAPPPFKTNLYLEAKLQSEPHAHAGHINHCFDYIRQALMCAADTNLEEVSFEEVDNGRGGKDQVLGAQGWGARRVCRPFWGVWGWAVRWGEGGEGII
ncbi:hypothetical protein BDW02DRAFT_490899 [Decorospora gaudefroyi]|uniref:Uncharacterized protein n=1 Tax=Decorospora gaudefroyi TaxID=184978 RepID=A0A6A5KPS3_9PLEO|nr:hypothetical protein BDW02DRAFT_490899 [Decorospora gaudefroyi]